jgi:hypothetical protein
MIATAAAVAAVMVVVVYAWRRGTAALYARRRAVWCDRSIDDDDGIEGGVQGSVCFQGSGCALVYQLGVARYLAAHFELGNARIIGVSGGALVAACLAARIDLGFAVRRAHAICEACRRPPAGPIGTILQAVSAALHAALEDKEGEGSGGGGSGSGSGADAHVAKHCDGRLFLQLTHRRTMGGRLLSRFGGVEALAHAVLSSMNLPFFFGPQYRLRAAPAGAGGGGGGGGGGSGFGGFGGFGGSGFGAGGSDRYVDGSLSDSAPVRRDGTTIRVSPSDPTAHVRPPPGMLVGWGRFVVPGDREYLERMDRQGFEDARRSHQLFVAGGWQERGT